MRQIAVFGKRGIVQKQVGRRISFYEAVKTCLVKFFTFSGRASRAEYWYFVLFSWGVHFFGYILIYLTETDIIYNSLLIFGWIMSVPVLTVSVRRLHDINRSGLWLALALTGVGYLWLIYWAIKNSGVGENRFGQSGQ